MIRLWFVEACGKLYWSLCWSWLRFVPMPEKYRRFLWDHSTVIWLKAQKYRANWLYWQVFNSSGWHGLNGPEEGLTVECRKYIPQGGGAWVRPDGKCPQCLRTLPDCGKPVKIQENN